MLFDFLVNSGIIFYLSGVEYTWREENMAKIKYNFDKDNAVFYCLEGDARNTLNLTLDTDTLLRIDVKNHKAVGLTIANFDKHYAKFIKLFGTRNEELAIDYFQMFLRDLNLFIDSSVNKRTALYNFVVGKTMKGSIVYA